VRKPIGPYREAAVALIFENERVVYGSDEELLRFFAAEGIMLVRCGVSKAALVVLEEDALTDPDVMVSAYLRNRELIQNIVERKYRAHRFETGGIVVVRLQDLPA
jgi:hypothetical protein